jgi:uncharacterized protein (TIGR00290 family)
MKDQPYKSFFNWSGGKDSALALYHAQKNRQYSIEKLLTNINESVRRVSMHGVREELLDEQAKMLEIPLQKMLLSDQPGMQAYEAELMNTMKQLHEEQYTHSLFGDIFLEDLRTYRETQLARVQMTAIFPLWKKDTKELMHEFLDLGFKTIVVCVKAGLLDESFAGRVIDKDFLKDLPANVDPCGENGEFHTFVFDGPIFKTPIAYKTGEKVFKEYKAPASGKDNCFTNQPVQPASMGFWFCDLLPG